MNTKLLFPTLILRLSLLLIISTASSYAENPPIKVMSFNIRNGLAKDGENAWPLRQAFVVETIRTFDPDLLGLQEVHRFQADYLIEQLPEYDFYGVARDDGKVKGEIVPVMVKRDRFEMIESGHYWLSETPEVIGSKGWDSALPRLASWTLIRDKQGNDKPFIFGNTHWDHRGQVARLESAKLIRKRIDSVLPEIPVIVTGDFNTHEKLDPYAELVTSTGSSGAPLLDTYRVIHPQVRDLEGTFSAFTGERARNRIDWILTSQDFVTLNASINYTQENGRYPSDHYPVDAVVRLK